MRSQRSFASRLTSSLVAAEVAEGSKEAPGSPSALEARGGRGLFRAYLPRVGTLSAGSSAIARDYGKGLNALDPSIVMDVWLLRR